MIIRIGFESVSALRGVEAVRVRISVWVGDGEVVLLIWRWVLRGLGLVGESMAMVWSIVRGVEVWGARGDVCLWWDLFF